MSVPASHRRPRCRQRLRWRDGNVDSHGQTQAFAGRRPEQPSQPAGSPIDVGHALTSDQLSAIAAVMRLFVDDDLANGVPPARTMYCDVCRQERPAPGFVLYDRRRLCNACATRFEICRARGLVQSIGAYLSDNDARRGA